MKETLKRIKELWNNKRYRAILWLVMYFIFFAIVLAIISGNDKVPVKYDSLDAFRDSKYSYVINNEIEVIDSVITYQNKTYEKDFFPQYNFNITPKEIYTLIKSGKLESQNFIDNSYTYLVKGLEYNKLLEDKITSDGNIRITIYKTDDVINKAVVNLSEFYKYDYVMEVTVK